MENNFLDTSIKQFRYYKQLGDRTFEQLSDEQLFWRYNAQSNSIAIIVSHLSGNMLSRFTNFLTEDGEKSWRNRDAEFDPATKTRKSIMLEWERGWRCLFESLEKLNSADLDKIIYIRNEGHTVTEAILRQVAHYSYHVGQIVFIGKMMAAEWKSLSIPLNASAKYNEDKFAKEKMRAHFTDEILKKDPENEF